MNQFQRCSSVSNVGPPAPTLGQPSDAALRGPKALCVVTLETNRTAKKDYAKANLDGSLRDNLFPVACFS
ncbi:NHL repeat-containing protein 2 [Anopheles sinensis]|uniref:NHL repeat-containing protein 2 n=1 Tax=Anopheles sinensis TaxID=74873 RepID=A0A084VJN8_ANOSI|nr:NHL repeat-containing protein 2 [Anopheles sinensis]